MRRKILVLFASLLVIWCGSGDAASEEEAKSRVSKGPGAFSVEAENPDTDDETETIGAQDGSAPQGTPTAQVPVGHADRREDPVAKYIQEAAAAVAELARAMMYRAECGSAWSPGVGDCLTPTVEFPDPLQLGTGTPEARASDPAPVRARITPGEAGAKAVARLQLPTLKAQVGPDPAQNEWGMIPVGYPVWLFADGETSLSDSDEVEDLAVSLEAELTSMTFAMGDGTIVTCAGPGTRHSADVEPGTPSPTCGHTYQRVPRGSAKSYTVTATAHWSITWTALGESDTVTDTTSSTTELPVGELQVVVTE